MTSTDTAFSLLEAAKKPENGRSLRRLRAQDAIKRFNAARLPSTGRLIHSAAERNERIRYGISESYAIMVAATSAEDVIRSPTVLREYVGEVHQWVLARSSAGLELVTKSIFRVLMLLDGLELSSRINITKALLAPLTTRDVTLTSNVMALRFVVGSAYHDTVLLQAFALLDKKEFPQARSVLNAEDSAFSTLLEAANDFDQRACDVDFNAAPYTPASLVRINADRESYLAQVDAAHFLAQGDQNWTKALTDDPDKVHLWAQLSQDDYRTAYNAIVGKDMLEVEGACICRLARYHAKITKLDVLAHEMYLCAIQLGAAFAPAQPSGTWYHEATAAVQARRDRIAAEDAQLWHNKRKSVYEQLAASFEVFKTPALKSDHALCEYIFAHWPPRTKGPSTYAEQVTGEFTRKSLIQIVARYHPDKNGLEIFKDEKWLVTCEEIVKELNSRQVITKGMSTES